MRWITAISVLMLAGPVYGQPNEAEKLFRAMEKTVREAKSLKVVCEVEAEFSGGRPGKVKGTAQLGGGNKARQELEGEMFGMAAKFLMVSDGKNMILRETPGGDSGKIPISSHLHEMLAGALARVGFLQAAGLASQRPRDGTYDMDKHLPVGDFQLGAKETIGKVEAQIIEYTVALDAREKFKVKLWIDPQTTLPLKRGLVSMDKKDDSITETYSEFVLNPKFETRAFDLPK